VGYELHPDTPPKGTRLSDRLPGTDLEALYAPLRARGEELGLVFNPVETLPNSRLALESAEYARDRGCFAEFHDHMFRAYFTQGRDIGRFHVVADIARQCGLDPDAVRTVLESKIYAPRLAAAREEGRAYGLKGIPLFIVNERFSIVGAQPLERFRGMLSSIVQGDGERSLDEPSR